MSLSSFLQPIAALGSIGWAVLVIATPTLAASRSVDDLGVRLATVAYAAGSFICHQRPDRSFAMHGIALPVCGRCTGIYVGAAIGAIVALLPWWSGRLSRASTSWWRRAIVLAAVPTAVSFAVEWLTPIPVSNLARAAAGVVAGVAVAAYVIAVPSKH